MGSALVLPRSLALVQHLKKTFLKYFAIISPFS